MGSNAEILERLIKRTMEAFPQNAPIVEQSTPVVAFGDCTTARVATLGINPSYEEFQDSNGVLLKGKEKRLVDHESLGGDFTFGLSESQAEKVIAGCSTYFLNRPFGWFDDIENVVLKPNGMNYRSGEACHLDVIQWATNPIWSKITNQRECVSLLENDSEFLKFQIASQGYDFIFLNGNTVIKQVKSLNLVKLQHAGFTPFGHGVRKSRLWLGELGETKFIGWNLNIQRHETTPSNKAALSEWITSQIQNKRKGR
jgi:hypothetical protein